jgi:hypothetical protein
MRRLSVSESCGMQTDLCAVIVINSISFKTPKSVRSTLLAAHGQQAAQAAESKR